ncbi:MAG: sigma-70 family RNA polymerase sigma factor [Gemmataceae bacterium]|nr:sigma-70 family RNA polymerase sigma factor [Gemmataceae bacterium]
MATAKLSEMVSRLGRRPAAPTADTDAELLGRFLATRDEAAFAEVVRRHGPLVFGVCRRTAGDYHLAEDAFQAVFVVLAAKAGSVRPRAALPSWLYGVARRTALRARTMRDRRRKWEARARMPVPPSPAPEDDELVAVVDEEVGRLPDGLRRAVVLCELQGKSRKEAAAALGVPEGTVSSRLAAARKALADRLRRRGVALSVTGLTAALGQVAAAAVPCELVARAVASSLGVAPAPVAALSNGVLRMMQLSKLKLVPVALALAAGVVYAVGVGPAADDKKNPGAGAPGSPKPVATAKPADPKPLPKGPNKILVYASGHLTLLDPDGKNPKQVSENRQGLMPGTHTLLSPDGTGYATLIQVDKPGETPAGESPRRKLYVRKFDEPEPGRDFGVHCQTFCWSPDGTRLAVSEFPDAGDKLPDAAHHLVDAKTGAKTALKLPANHIALAWAAGDKLLTTSIAGTPQAPVAKLHLMNLDGTEHKAVTDGKNPSIMGLPSPDGKRVLAMQFEVKEETPAERKARDDAGKAPPRPASSLVVIDIATGKATPVEGVPLNTTDVTFCWSPDGKRIAYVWREKHEGDPKDLIDKETESHLVVCDPDGKNAKTILTEKGHGQWVITLGAPDWR